MISQKFNSFNLSALLIPTKTKKTFDHDCFHTPTYIILAVNSIFKVFIYFVLN